jgi:hypothetical protein
VKPEVDAMFGNFKKWYKAMQFNATDPSLPVKPDTPVRSAHQPPYGCHTSAASMLESLA